MVTGVETNALAMDARDCDRRAAKSPDWPVEVNTVDIDVEDSQLLPSSMVCRAITEMPFEKRLTGAVEKQIKLCLETQHKHLLSTISGLMSETTHRRANPGPGLNGAEVSELLSEPSNNSPKMISKEPPKKTDDHDPVRYSRHSHREASKERLSKHSAAAKPRPSLASIIPAFKETANTFFCTQLSKEERMLTLAMGDSASSGAGTGTGSKSISDLMSNCTSLRTTESLEPVGWKRKLKSLLRSARFELAMGILVCSNAVFIGWEVDYVAHHPGDSVVPLYCNIISYSYSFLFMVELILRLVNDWYEFLWQDHINQLLWNYLDIFIVASSIVEIGLDIAAMIQSTTSGFVNLSNVRVVRLVRVFRLIRLFRIARFVRFVRALRMMVYSILCTLKAIFWAIILLATIIYIYSILFTSAATADITRKLVESDSHAVPNLQKYWGSIDNSMRSLFTAISGGISWIEVIEPLTEVSVIWGYFFLAYISFTYFAVLNVVTGVFCQAAMQSTSEDKDAMLQTFLRHKKIYTERFVEIFKNLDEKGTGIITLEEFLENMEDEEVRNYFASLDLDSADALTIFDLFDDAGVNGIRIDEFVMGCLRLKGFARSSDMLRLLHDNRILMEHLEQLADHFNLSTYKPRSAEVLQARVSADIMSYHLRMSSCQEEVSRTVTAYETPKIV